MSKSKLTNRIASYRRQGKTVHTAKLIAELEQWKTETYHKLMLPRALYEIYVNELGLHETNKLYSMQRYVEEYLTEDTKRRSMEKAMEIFKKK